VMTRLNLAVSHVNWFSTYRVHHRVANQFQRGQVFLLGDAAHVHSPVGGQGMNTGIGDAMNLAWKLAAFIHGQADIRILATYEPERIAFARQLVQTTDRAFTFVTNNGAFARWVRLRLVPRILPAFFSLTPARRLMFRTVSQIGIRYRSSKLSAGQAGRVHGGDRLPWVPPENGQPPAGNFAPLSSLAWQVHVYGDATPGLTAACDTRGLPLHTFPWRSAMRTAGLQRGAAYLVRPDGYVALADSAASPATLHRFLDDRGLQPAAKGKGIGLNSFRWKMATLECPDSAVASGRHATPRAHWNSPMSGRPVPKRPLSAAMSCKLAIAPRECRPAIHEMVTTVIMVHRRRAAPECTA
jgi:hypothetical protein